MLKDVRIIAFVALRRDLTDLSDLGISVVKKLHQL